MTLIEGRTLSPSHEPQSVITENPPVTASKIPSAAPPVDKRVKALVRFAISITALNVLGLAFLGFEQAPLTPVVCLAASYASALIFEAMDGWAWRRPPEFAGGWRAL